MNFPYLGLKVFTNLDMNDWTEHVGRRLLDDGDDTLCQIVKLSFNIYKYMIFHGLGYMLQYQMM